MLSIVAAAAMMASAAEPLKIRISRLYGGPTSVDQSLTVTCAQNTYSFKRSRNIGSERTIEFRREPIAPPKELTAAVVDVLGKFSGESSIEPWCASPSEDAPHGILSLEVYGYLSADDRDARNGCIEREGIYEPKSLWIVSISGDELAVDRDAIGRCTTKQDIDTFIRSTKGAKK